MYLFYPETQGRSLEEVDEIFHSVHGLRGALDVVKMSFTLPKRYGKDGQLLIRYEDTAESNEKKNKKLSMEDPAYHEVIKEGTDVHTQKVEFAG